MPSKAIFFFALVHLVRSSGFQYEVPEPKIEVFSPKGIRISIESRTEIQEVEFSVTIPRSHEALFHRAHRPEGAYWVYWNPDAVVHLYEKFQYKLRVKYLNTYCTREGIHFVDKVMPIVGRAESHEVRNVITGYPGFDESEHHMGRFASGRASNFQSSYSMVKNSNLNPVTKSRSSTTSGTFYLKPSGEVEASGYKSGSSFDSTRNQGEQWEHYRANLTAEELEEIRKSGFRGLDIGGKLFPSGVPLEFRNRFGFGDRGLKAEYHESTHETHESSSYSGSQPTVRFKFDDVAHGDAMSKSASGNVYSFESSSRQSNVAPQSGASYRTTEYVREEHSGPGLAQGFRTDQHSSYSYTGNIFSSVKSSRARYPEECVLTPRTDYAPSNSIEKVEKFAYELSCLATIAESTTKTEIRTLKDKNLELIRRLELLEQSFRKFEASCRCY